MAKGSVSFIVNKAVNNRGHFGLLTVNKKGNCKRLSGNNLALLRLERPCVLNCPLPKTPYETEPGKDTFAKSQPLVIYGVKFRDYFANRVAKCRVGGGVASAASHRSGRAQLRHPARLVMASPVCSAIRGRCGDPQPRFRTLDGFPTHESMTNPSLPSTGSPQVRFPGFTGTMKECDSPPSVSPRFVSFAWRYHPVRLCSSLPQVRRRLGAWSFRVWQPPANFYRMCLCPVLRPRQDLPTRPSRWFGTAPALANDEGSHD